MAHPVGKFRKTIAQMAGFQTEMLRIAALLWTLVSGVPQQDSTGLLQFKASSSAEQVLCDSCEAADLQNPADFDQCNFWGDPHYTETWGGLGRFDYQGLGVHWVVNNNETCDSFRMQAFHCQYRTSRNAVVLGFVIEVNGSVSGTVFVNDTFVEVSAGLENLVSPIGEISTQQLQNGGINVQTGDRCNFVNINGKPINFKPGYLLNAKVRARVGVTQNAGVCGSPQLFPTFVSDNSSFLFTSGQIEQLCEQCSSFGGLISPGCPGFVPPQPPTISNDLTEECEWAADPIEAQNAGSGPDIIQFCGPDTPIAANFSFPGPNQCIFKVSGGRGNSCDDICGLLGTTCSNMPGRVDSTGNTVCVAGDNDGPGLCNNTNGNLNTFSCVCDIPDIPFPGDDINDAEEVANNDPNISFQEAIDNCTVGCLANLTFDINIPPQTELEYLLRGCIIDWVYAENEDRADIVDNTQEQCPGLALTETCAEFTCNGTGLIPDPAKQDEHEEDGNFKQMYSCKGEAGCEEAKFRARRGAQVKEVLVVQDWCRVNRDYLGEEGIKQLDMFGPADQWRIISEGPAAENMDSVHIIQSRAKRSREMANTVATMFAQRRELANKTAQETIVAKAAAKPLFNPTMADTVQAFFTRVVGCEVPESQRRCGGSAVQHELEEDRSKLVGKVKGVDGVVEILKPKYECRRGDRYRVIGDHGGPAGMWRLEGGKTVPKTHVKEGGWKWVLEEPEPEAKAAKPIPVQTTPVATFTPKEHKKLQEENKQQSDEESSAEAEE
ncbi:SLC38A6, partial [Symbiodinium sp. CCMP2456]